MTFLSTLYNNFYYPQDRMGLTEPATALMEYIIDLHHFIFFFLLLISGLVIWLLIQIIDKFVYLYHVNNTWTKSNLTKVLIYTYGGVAMKTRKFKENNRTGLININLTLKFYV